MLAASAWAPQSSGLRKNHRHGDADYAEIARGVGSGADVEWRVRPAASAELAEALDIGPAWAGVETLLVCSAD